ncbi:MAG: lipopolysaccharide biosynthesis protein [Ilumatobacter sp.]
MATNDPLEELLDDRLERTGHSLGRAMGSGVRWMAPTQVLIQVVRVGSVFALTYLLLPEQIGLVGLVTVITGLFERVLGDTGTTTALVRHKGLTQGLASSVLFWNMSIGAAITAVLAIFAAPIAAFLGNSDATDIVRAMSLLAVINGMSYVPKALFRRHLQFKQLAAANLSNALVTGGGTIAFALAGFDEWSIVIGNVAGSAVGTIVSWALTPWRPSAHYSRARLREISGFSTHLTLQNVFGYVSFAGDRFIVGRFLGTEALGYYGLANRLMRYPIQTTAQTYRDVVFPNLAKIQDDFAAMTRAYRRSVGGIALLIFPLCATVAAVADPLVRVALNDNWLPAKDILGLVAITSGLQAVASTTGSLYNARGRSDLALRWQIASSIFLVACYSIGAQWDLVGVAWGYLIGIAALTPLAFAIPLRLIGARVRDVTGGLVVVGGAAALAGVSGHLVARWIDSTDAGDLAELVAGTAVSLMIYVGVVAAIRPPAVADLRRVLRRGQ